MSLISGRAGGTGKTERTCLRNDTWIKAAQDGAGKQPASRRGSRGALGPPPWDGGTRAEGEGSFVSRAERRGTVSLEWLFNTIQA